MTGVQNGPELQLQVRLNVFRADTISPLPTSCLVWLAPPPSSSSLLKSPQGPPWVWGGQGSHGSICWHGAVAALSCWQAQPWCFSMMPHGVYWQGAEALRSPGTARLLWGQAQHSQSSNTRQGGTFFPICVCYLPMPQCLHGLWKHGGRTDTPLQAGMDGAEHGEGAGSKSVTWAGEERCLPRAVRHCNAGIAESSAPASPQLQHGADWSPAMSRHYERYPDTQT